MFLDFTRFVTALNVGPAQIRLAPARQGLLAHEHRARDSGLPWLREELSRWDEGDEHIESLQAAAAVEGLVLRPLWSERPICVHRHEFRSWTADLSVFEVLLQEDA